MLGIYCRVSSQKQVKQGLSLEDQERRGREFADRNGWEHEVYVEKGKSGKMLGPRSEWFRLAKGMEDGRVTKVCMSEGDRLSRNNLDGQIMLRNMKDNNIDFYMGGRLIDLNNEYDKLVIDVSLAVSEFEGNNKIKRTTEGIRSSIDNGTKATVRLYGYRRSNKIIEIDGKQRQKWEILPEQAKAIKRMYELYIQGMSIQKITKTLNREGYLSWSGKYFENSKINRSLKQPQYAGLSYNTKGELIESKVYEAIIDRDTWDKAQKLVKMNPSRSFRKKADHISTGILKCGKCGEPYHFHTHWSRGESVGYYDHHNSGVKKCDQLPVLIREGFLDLLLSSLYMMTLHDQESVKKIYQEEQRRIQKEKDRIARDIDRIEKREAELAVEKKRLIQFIRKGAIDESDVANDMREINVELRKLATNREEFMKSIKESQERCDSLNAKFGAENLLKFADGPNMLKREMLRSLVDKATITHRDLFIQMITGQRFKLSYPKARRDEDHDIGEYDRDYVFEYIEAIESEFSSTKEFRAMFDKTLERLDGRKWHLNHCSVPGNDGAHKLR